MESENQVLRNQALLQPPISNQHEQIPIPSTSSNDDSVDILFKCMFRRIGFDEGKPAAGVTIYKCLLHWKLFEAGETNVFDRFIHMLGSAIEAPTTARAKSMMRGRSFSDSAQTSLWQSIVDNLDNLLTILQENYVPAIVIQQLIAQLFSFINMQLFNNLLLLRECCTFSNGEFLKSGLSELKIWCDKAKPEYVGSALEELMHTRQAVSLLVIFRKHMIDFDEIQYDLCPGLTFPQMHRICTQYSDDKYNSQSTCRHA